MIGRTCRPGALSPTSFGVAVLALASVLVACTQDRSPIGASAAGAGVGPAAAGVTGPGAGAGGSDAGGGGLGPVPEVADCGCLAGAADDECRSCLDEVGDGGTCAERAAACEVAEPGYCALVFDCAALCPVADARCIDVCLGADDAARAAAEALAACACEACAGDCGEDGC